MLRMLYTDKRQTRHVTVKFVKLTLEGSENPRRNRSIFLGGDVGISKQKPPGKSP